MPSYGTVVKSGHKWEKETVLEEVLVTLGSVVAWFAIFVILIRCGFRVIWLAWNSFLFFLSMLPWVLLLVVCMVFVGFVQANEDFEHATRMHPFVRGLLAPFSFPWTLVKLLGLRWIVAGLLITVVLYLLTICVLLRGRVRAAVERVPHTLRLLKGDAEDMDAAVRLQDAAEVQPEEIANEPMRVEPRHGGALAGLTGHQRWWVYWCKAHFDCTPSAATDAQIAVVRQQLQREMKKKGVRNVHIAMHVDRIIACAFVPTPQELDAGWLKLHFNFVRPVWEWWLTKWAKRW